MNHLHRLMRNTKPVFNPGKMKGESKAAYRERLAELFLKNNPQFAKSAEVEMSAFKHFADHYFMGKTSEEVVVENPRASDITEGRG